jgi:hypothetical protein
MKRREFIKVVCGLIGAWPIAAYAQHVSSPRRIGVLGSNATIWKPWAAAFVARLQELGWIDGDTAAIEYRWTEGSSKRVSEIASEFLRQNVDVIVTYGSAVTVLKQVAAEIPIASGSTFCARLFRRSVAWRSSLMLAMRSRCWRLTESNPRRKRSASKRHGWESGGRKTLQAPLRC